MTPNLFEHYDLAIIMVYLFFAFFGFLVLWLHREGKREGYPLVTDRLSDRVQVVGFPGLPADKTYFLADGSTVTTPNARPDVREIKLAQTARFFGAPYEPTGNPMIDGVGPGSWAERSDTPDRTMDGRARIVPLRADAGFYLERRDPDPRGKPVIGFDGVTGGIVTDVWIDRAEFVVRYFEVEVRTANGVRSVLLPNTFCVIKTNGIHVHAVKGAHFADAPGIRNPDQVTLLEEDKIAGYYGGGTLYADPARVEPLI